MRTRIASTGSYVPSQRVTNADLVQFPTAARALVEEKTGIRARRFAAAGEVTSDLGACAARRCLEAAGVSPLAVDAVLLATSSPDRPQPATATRVQHLIGATNAFAVDVNSVCAGALYALHLADSLVASGACRSVLVVAAEVYSRILCPTDFATYPYFGDGAGAMLLTQAPAGPEILATSLGSDGSGAEVIQVPAGGTMLPVRDAADQRLQYFTMKGRAVYDFAVDRGARVICDVAARAGIRMDEIRRVVPHQANKRIIEAIAARTGIPGDRFFTNLEEYGNTAGASVALALDELASGGELRPGDYVVLVAFGGGLSWGGSVIRW